MNDIIQLRQELHKYPELSGKEKNTAERIIQFLSKQKPDNLISGIAGHGIAAVYNGCKAGPTLLFRCDMDALPINEMNDLPYKSSIDGVSHLCGHDGHMTMISGLAARLHKQPVDKGRVILFYQPEEENGKGAKNSIAELKEMALVPDYAFAIHNIPKQPFGSIILGQYTFSAASKGLIIKLTGKNSHAAYPENGISPAAAIADIVQIFNNLKDKVTFNDFVLLTIVHIRLGEPAFGTSPGEAEIMVTLRAFDNEDMERLTEFSKSSVKGIANKYKLKVEFDFADEFPASVCDKELTRMVKRLAEKQNLKVILQNQPNRWSEDFAHFTSNFPSIIFGLGIGEDHPDLHTNTYDFPDEVLSVGIDILESIVREFE